MKKLFFTFIILLCSCAGSVQVNHEAKQNATSHDISPEAVWHSGGSFRERVIERCSPLGGQDFGECFIAVMKDSGASPSAIAFTKLTGNTGYLRNFRETGVVDIAYVHYPFRANENYGCFLVNGDPPVIDVDAYDIVQKIELKKNKQYAEIFFAFPEASIWPGDRFGDYCVQPDAQKGIQRFIVSYRILNNCHACELLGSAKVAFDFDSAGKFLDTELLHVEAAVKVFNDPEKPVSVAVGSMFVIVLQSNRTTGYRWEYYNPKNASVVKLMGIEYRASGTGFLGSGGREVLMFEAVGKGKSEITLNYARPWEKDVPPAKSVSFKVNAD